MTQITPFIPIEMMKTTFAILTLMFFVSAPTMSQVGIGNTNPKSMLDISASNPSLPSNSDGILIPRVNSFPIINPNADQNGMMVFLTSAFGTNDIGFYYWSDPQNKWISIGAEEWKDGVNVSGDPYIYATQARLLGTDMVITDDGRIGFGTDDPVERFEFRGPGDNDFQITSANTNPPNFILYNTGGTLEAPTVLAANGEIGSFIVKTHDGTNIRENGGFRFFMDGIATPGSVPSKFVINTTPQGSTSQIERIVVRSTGNVGIGTTTPSQLLDVNGNARVRGLQAGAVYSDTNGNLSNTPTGPVTFAAGKINANGTSPKITGATVSNISTGVYQITFDSARSTSHYLIQVSASDCSSCGTDDSIGIYYSNQTNNGFRVIIGSNDNGSTAKVPVNLEFMFTAVDF
ncbi:hypothetical protein KXJ69_06740 [Aureisphaera sp. CAU 1614]|uniref:Uncharacterized protein n=1 Tax=Halomarinibacterium sedimenti TaxID=2857106 RepID=A0A9X1FNA4_9FLAO|nr:hypothetical protein [Halomarinibacterium sedimenti]MBW2937798.1 hypothetical protein [Halomarinibacterium sedimenti]